jgi:hypothetical protein
LYSREAYCEAHLHKKFQKIQRFITFTAACPQKAVLASFGPLDGFFFWALKIDYTAFPFLNFCIMYAIPPNFY